MNEHLLQRLECLLDRVERLLPADTAPPDWEAAIAYRWRAGTGNRRGALHTIPHPHNLHLTQLRNIDRQKALLEANTRQFVHGHPANNALLWGSRGTGKSSLIKALLTDYAADGLRLIEVDRDDLTDLADIAEQVRDRPERFVVFSDDLSFEAGDGSYKALKAMLDGSISAPPDNLLIYATSNRRHLLPEYMADNNNSRNVDGEIHHGEAVEEKISLSERFGLWVSFHPFGQDAYLDIVNAWLDSLGVSVSEPERLREDALRYALARGSRSGRVAWQFARDWAGREADRT
jgi:uncharacterized protein